MHNLFGKYREDAGKAGLRECASRARKNAAEVRERTVSPAFIAGANHVPCLCDWAGAQLAAAVTVEAKARSRTLAVRPRDMYALYCILLFNFITVEK